MMRSSKKQRTNGITLIALVITIIVLLVIAGVSISLVLGENGVLNQAKNANQTQNVATGKEQASMRAAGYVSEYMEKVYVDNDSTVGAMTTGEYVLAQMDGKEDGDYRYSVSGNTVTVTSKKTGQALATGTIGENGGIVWSDTVASNGGSQPVVDEESIMPDDPLMGKVSVGDYIYYDPTYGVTDTSKLEYTSPVGELRIYAEDSLVDSDGEMVPSEYVADLPDNFDDSINSLGLFNGNGVIDMSNNTFVGSDNKTYIVEKNVSGNGYEPQTFRATSDFNLWKVFDDGSTSGNIKIISESVLETINNNEFYVEGILGYKNFSTEINNICSILANGKGAKSARSFNHRTDLGLGDYNFPSDDIEMLKMMGKDYPVWSLIDVAEYDRPPVNSTGYKNMYYSRYGMYYVDSDGAPNYFFNADIVYFYTCEYNREKAFVENLEGCDGKCILPVVVLKRNVEYKGGDGTEEDPWTFQ